MRATILLILSLLLWAPPARGDQDVPSAGTRPPTDTLDRSGLPPEAAERILAFYRHPATTRFQGETRISAEQVVEGGVAVLGGPLRVAGRIRGGVLVVGGDVELLPGSVVDGEITVVGGAILGMDDARIGGEIVAYSSGGDFPGGRERLAAARGPGRPGMEGDGDPAARTGSASFLVATGQSYNRVEGMPILFGPVIETEGSNPLRARALAIYRTDRASFFATDHWGHDVSVEQFVGGRRALRFGVGLHARMDPIEEWHLSDTENGLSTLLLHRDLRDHYERKGWSAYAVLSPPASGISVRGEFRAERHSALASGDPWTLSLFRASDDWRLQPLAAEGDLRSAGLEARLDTRNDRGDPSTGWLIRGELEHALDSDLTRPAVAVTNSVTGYSTLRPPQEFGRFTTGRIDLRRYNRIDPRSRLALRMVLGGSPGGSPLPAQRQHALGGEATLPGYGLFQLDCGARDLRGVRAEQVPDAPGTGEPDNFYPAYGCDRFALVQGEYRGKLSFRFDWREDAEEYDEEPGRGRGERGINLDWVTFVDAGRGWATAEDRSSLLDPLPGWEPASSSVREQTAVDAGIGLLFDRLGVYLAVPLRGGGGVNLFARLGPRL